MEVLMRKTFLVLSFITLFGIISVAAQTPGLRVDANIPFDFYIGQETFAAGTYKMTLVHNSNSVYSVSLYDRNNKRIFNSIAIRNPLATKKHSEMVFAVSANGHALEKLRTPDMGFNFAISKSEKLLAQTKRTSVPVDGTPN
jgi:hypothetical protein